MCDIYETECNRCGRDIPMHIGDFSTGRRNVTVYCPDCHEGALEYLTRYGHTETIVFQDWGEYTEEGGGLYLILIDRPRSIHLN